MASSKMKKAAFGICALFGLGAPVALRAQEHWPARAIQMIVPSLPGSPEDVLARALAQRLSESLKKPVIVDNKPGASGAIGISAVVKAPSDGYTLLYTTASQAVIAPAVLKSTPFNTTKDLTPIAQTVVGGVMLLVNKDVPAKNLPELVALVKANPDQFSYGTWGAGSTAHLIMEWLKGQTGMKLTHVPYRGSPPVLTDLASGVLKIGWSGGSTSLLPFVHGGKIRVIAISGDTRVPQLPDVATMREQGYAFDQSGWFGLFAPAGTDKAIVRRLTDEVNKIQASPETASLMKNLNFAPPPVKTAAQFTEIVSQDLATWKKIVTDAKINLDD